MSQETSKLEQKSQANEDTNMTAILNNLAAILKKTNTSHRAIPSWDSSSQKSAVSINSHIKLFENLAERMGWTEDEKALELILTLKGHARRYVESLGNETTRNFDKLKNDLLETFTRRKPEAQRLREWNACRWDTKSQTLTEFAAMLMSKLKKLNDDEVKTPDTELFLKNRFMEAIKDENPEFGRYLDLNRPENQDFKKLVTFCQNKYDVFCSVEQEEEERRGSEIFFNNGNYNKRIYNQQMDYQQHPFAMMWPFPFYPYPGQHPMMQQMYQPFKHPNDKQVRFSTPKNENSEQHSKNVEQESKATKVPKNHNVKYIQEANKVSKNL